MVRVYGLEPGKLGRMGLGTSSLSTFAYDGRNRLLSTTDPLGKIERYTYDGNDNLLTRLTPKNETISFAYDAVNQLLSKTLPGSQITQYNYDLVGNLTTVTDPDSVLAMTYDLANRLTTVKTDGSPNQPAVTLAYSYDLTGNRLSLTDPVQVASYRYDALNRLQSLTQPTTPATRLPNLLATWPGDGSAADPVGGQMGCPVRLFAVWFWSMRCRISFSTSPTLVREQNYSLVC